MRNNKAFTLIELLVVVLIIGILAAIALPQYQKAVERAHMTEAIIQVRALAEAEKAYYMANDEYAATFDKLDVSFSGTPNDDTNPTTISQRDFTLNIESNHVYAAYTKAKWKNGMWYIAYYLTEPGLYCTAYDFDTKAQSVCKTIGSAPIVCPWTPLELCYKIQ